MIVDHDAGDEEVSPFSWRPPADWLMFQRWVGEHVPDGERLAASRALVVLRPDGTAYGPMLPGGEGEALCGHCVVAKCEGSNRVWHADGSYVMLYDKERRQWYPRPGSRYNYAREQWERVFPIELAFP